MMRAGILDSNRYPGRHLLEERDFRLLKGALCRRRKRQHTQPVAPVDQWKMTLRFETRQAGDWAGLRFHTSETDRSAQLNNFRQPKRFFPGNNRQLLYSTVTMWIVKRKFAKRAR